MIEDQALSDLIFALSPSMQNALSSVGTEKAISTAELARALFEMHFEYADGRAATLRLIDPPAKKPAPEWLTELQHLFDPLHFQSFAKYESQSSKKSAAAGRPPLHGGLLLIGLSLLEPHLREQLEDATAFAASVKELRELLSEILTERGRALYESSDADKAIDLFDSGPIWPSDPLLQPDQDLLGWAAFARYLAERIAIVPKDFGAYVT